MTMISEQVFQIGLLFRPISSNKLLISLLIFFIFSMIAVVVAVQSVFATTATTGDNKTNGSTVVNMTFLGNMMRGNNMTMPGGNMTFGSSLQNAKMHLTEAIMDLKSGNT